jgi:hypothetical protein
MDVDIENNDLRYPEQASIDLGRLRHDVLISAVSSAN